MLANEEGTARTAVLFDFGGVLTTSVVAAFEGLGRELGAEPRLLLRLLSKDAESSALLVAHEEGRIGEREFEDGFTARLRAHGVDVDPEGPGLLSRLQARMRPDTDMLALVARVRADGYRVGMLSNSLGDDCYAGYDLTALFDAVTVSGEIGVRKPSRRAYAVACERLGVRPEETVMVDDLEQNITAAARLGIAGVVHREARTTRAELARLLHPLSPGDAV
ncbi:HAD family phosphatase [Streptomyces sp. SID14478]|uniref:HAD family hydrolase n=1 Tax=Streptomyces sp. SID14478 TaxID=2706073 RepID=UPI0013DAF731|nr:HAD family phosphatase [Streptomyces sp. SID14478]NEB79157.1 HAD family phosphatase [Streptomyces sp. SID14478]